MGRVFEWIREAYVMESDFIKSAVLQSQLSYNHSQIIHNLLQEANLELLFWDILSVFT